MHSTNICHIAGQASARERILRATFALMLSSALVACGSDNDAADDEDPAIAASFSSVQENVFTASCTECHGGNDPSAGLNLDAGSAYASLGGTGSTGVAFLIAGEPDNSYLIKKLEGAADINGQQMPRGREPLPAATIQIVRDWITGGALNN